MASPNLTEKPNGLVTVPYSIYTGRSEGSTGQDAALGHGSSGNQATVTLQIKPEDLEQCLIDLLGIYKYDQSNGYLSRTTPARHPFMPWLRASRVTSVKGMRLTNTSTLSTVASGGGSPWPTFDHLQVGVLFTQPRYVILNDADTDRYFPPTTASDGITYRQEWQRYCTWQQVPSIESLTREAASLKWAEGGGTGPAVGSPFNSPWPRHLQKQDIICRWWFVPAFKALLSSNSTIPPLTLGRALNLEAGLYHVNDATFRGWPAGTLLFRGWQAEWNEAPYRPDATALHEADPSLTLTVDLQFTYFQPPKGSTTEGHNLAPFAPAGGGDGLWYKVVEQRSNRPLFDPYPFEKLFALPG